MVSTTVDGECSFTHWLQDARWYRVPNAVTFIKYSWSAKRKYALWKASNKRRKGENWRSSVDKTRFHAFRNDLTKNLRSAFWRGMLSLYFKWKARPLHLKVRGNWPFFVWRPFSKANFQKSILILENLRTVYGKLIFSWQDLYQKFTNWSSGTTVLLSLKTAGWIRLKMAPLERVSYCFKPSTE